MLLHRPKNKLEIEGNMMARPKRISCRRGVVQALVMMCVMCVSSVANAFEVDDVPADNLVTNPWFRNPAYQPSGEGWIFYTEGSSLLWAVTDKDSQPAPDNADEGTSVRWAETRPACTTGDKSGADAYFFQVLEGNPDHRFLKFHVWWVAHEVEVLEYNIYGSSSADGPWTWVWRPFHQVCEVDCVAEVSGAGGDRTLEWINLTATTPEVEGQLEAGWNYYKVEGHVRYVKDSPDDCDVGAKTTGIYFAAAATGDSDIITPPTDNPDGGVPADGALIHQMANPMLTPVATVAARWVPRVARVLCCRCCAFLACCGVPGAPGA